MSLLQVLMYLIKKERGESRGEKGEKKKKRYAKRFYDDVVYISVSKGLDADCDEKSDDGRCLIGEDTVLRGAPREASAISSLAVSITGWLQSTRRYVYSSFSSFHIFFVSCFDLFCID